MAPRSLLSHPPPPSSSKDTSVNIASAFERARWAARAQSALNPTANQPEPDREIDQSEHNGSLDGHSQSRKRKKGRRPSDPSYRYRPGDSASSDSPAGEGIADKRHRREKKARLAQLQQLQSLPPSKSTRRPSSSRPQRLPGLDHHPDSDDLSPSDQDTGPGITSTRGRRVLKDTQSTSDQRRPPSTRRSRSTRRKTVGPDDDTDLSLDPGPGIAPSRARRQSPSRSKPDPANNKSHPAAKFFLADPTSPQQLEEPPQPQARPQPDEPGTTDSSRLTLGLSTDSYDFAEEERIVQALETQTRQQRLFASDSGPASGHTGQLRHRNSPAQSPRSVVQSESEDLGRRSDSGMQEIEEVLATSRQMPPPISQPRTLPLALPSTRLSIAPISEETEPDPNQDLDLDQEQNQQHDQDQQEQDELLVPERVTLGAQSAYRLNSLFSCIWRPALGSKLVWMSMLGTLLAAILINSFRTGDLQLPYWSRNPPSHSQPAYMPPSDPIENLDELVGRLKQLEGAFGTLSAAHTSAAERVAQAQENARARLAYEIGLLEMRLETEVAGREKLEEKLTKQIDDGIGRLNKQLESIVSGRKHDVGEREKLQRTLDSVSTRLMGLQQADGTVRREMTGIVDKAVQKRVLEYNLAVEGAKKAVVKEVLGKVDKMEFVSEAKVKEMLEQELVLLGQQVEGQVSLVRKQLEVALSGSVQGSKAPTGQLGSGGSRGEVAGMIEAALERYARDETGERDFALLTAGGRVIPQLTTETYTVYSQRQGSWLIGLLTGAESKVRGRGPGTALMAGSAVGMCWPFEGSVGQLGILLSRKIIINAISIEHVSKDLVIDYGSAPREIEVWGVEDGERLITGVYDVMNGGRIQRFEIGEGEAEQESQKLRMVRQAIVVKVRSNYGNKLFTCLYRVRVHGIMESDGGDDNGGGVGGVGGGKEEEVLVEQSGVVE